MTAPIINNYYSNYWENVHFERNAHSKNVNSNKESNSPQKNSNVASKAQKATGFTNSVVSEVADEVTLSNASKGSRLEKIESFAKDFPKTAKVIKVLGKVVGVASDAFDGYGKGKEVAEQHYNGNDNHDAKVRNKAITGGVVGSVAGGTVGSFLGATAGATIGSIVPVFGTLIGGGIGRVLGGYGGSSIGADLGAEIGAYSGEKQYNREQYQERLQYQHGPRYEAQK